uniref:Nitroreductase domain-containing protein n=1 Tax=Alexandrium catenella TaxID=2925 RepID=A0A7S1LFL9_ALECA
MEAPRWQRLWLLCNASASVVLAVALWRLRRTAAAPLPSEEEGREEHPAEEKSAQGAMEKRKRTKVPIPSADQTLALLKGRRSIFPKDYNGRGRAIADEDIQLLLEGANWAPTHKRTEPWRFVVFRGEGMNRVLEATVEGNRAASTEDRGGETFEAWFADWEQSVEKKWKRCDVLIALSMLRQAQPDKCLPEWEELSAVACAVQNLHLMATALGLAGYWSSWNVTGRDSEAMAKLLGLSREAGDRCLGFFVLGSSDLVGKVRCGRGSIDEKTRWICSDPVAGG